MLYCIITQKGSPPHPKKKVAMRLKIMKIYKLLEAPKGSHVRSNKAAGYYETVQKLAGGAAVCHPSCGTKHSWVE